MLWTKVDEAALIITDNGAVVAMANTGVEAEAVVAAGIEAVSVLNMMESNL